MTFRILIIIIIVITGCQMTPNKARVEAVNAVDIGANSKALWNYLKTDKEPPPISVQALLRWSLSHPTMPQAQFVHAELVHKNIIQRSVNYDWMADLKRASDAGYVPAEATYGACLQEGDGVPIDEALGQKFIEKALKENEPIALMHQAETYRLGSYGEEKQFDKAMAYYQKAAECGYQDGIVGIASILAEEGKYSEALSKLMPLVTSHNPSAEALLGTWYFYGKGVGQDLEESYHYVSESVESSNGHEGSFLFNLAQFYEYGLGTHTDNPKAINLYEKAYQEGNHDAGLRLVNLYLLDTAANVSKAIAILRTLCWERDKFAEAKLGYFLLEGKYVTKDLSAGKLLLIASARSGNDDAIATLAQNGIAWENVSAAHDKQVIASFKIRDWGDPLTIPYYSGGQINFFIVDTGCDDNCVDKAFFSDLRPFDDTIQIQAPSGVMEGKSFYPPPLKVGPFQLSDLGPVVGVDLSLQRAKLQLPIVGIIGAASLQNVVMQIDFDHQKLTFLKPDDGDHPEWGNSIHLRELSNIPKAVVRINGNDELMKFDTGVDTDGFLTADAFSRLAASTKQSILSGPGATLQGRVKNNYITVSQMEVGPMRYSNLLLEDSKDDEGALGCVFLERHLTTFDFPRHRLYLKPNKEFFVKHSTGLVSAGFDIDQNSAKEFVVTSVVLNGPAEKAGLHAGDVLVTINGVEMNTVNASNFFIISNVLNSKNITIRVRRLGTIKSISLNNEVN